MDLKFFYSYVNNSQYNELISSINNIFRSLQRLYYMYVDADTVIKII